MAIYIIIIIIITVVYILHKYLNRNINDNFTNSEGKHLEYVHIPKNAGTSIENLGNRFGIKWGRFNTNYGSTCDKCNYYIWHTPCFRMDDNVDYFTTIRNPYDRIISEFYYVNGGKLKRGELGEDKHINIFYKWFDEAIEKYNKNDTAYGCHLMPQSNYVYDGGNQRIKHLIYMDKDMNTNLQNLFNEYNLKIDVNEFENNNTTKKEFNKKDLCRECLNKIYNFYRIDFDNFGYDKL